MKNILLILSLASILAACSSYQDDFMSIYDNAVDKNSLDYNKFLSKQHQEVIGFRKNK